MTTTPAARLLIAVAFAAVLPSLFGACARPGSEAVEEPTPGAAPEGADPNAAADDAKDPCARLVTRVCAAAGDTSASCDSAKTTLPLLSPGACSVALADFAATEVKLTEQGKNCRQLVAALCERVNPESCEMVKQRTPAFSPQQCATMFAQIDDVVAELKEHEKSSEPLSAEQQAAIGAPDAPSFGPADAKVTVVEFSDFECPYCSRAAEVTSRLRERYADRVRLVFRHFPLSFHQNARGAAEASLAAHSQGKFWEFHDRLFAHQDRLERSALGEHARAVGLDVDQLERALTDGTHASRVTSDVALGNDVDVQGTPTLFVNGRRVENPLDFDAVARQIDAALSE